MSKSKLFMFFAFLFACQFANAANRYVRAGATGSGDGSDWQNAYSSLPSTLVRGDTYYVADGTYAAYTFDDAPSSGLNITIKKAVASDHGTDSGWQAVYGDGQAAFGTFTFRTSNYVIDGQTRNENDWFDSAAYGFSVGSSSQQRQIIIQNYGNAPDNIVVKYVYLPGWSAAMPSTTQRILAIDVDDYDGGTVSTGLVFSRMYVSNSNNVWFLRTTNGAIVEYSASNGVAGNSANHGEIVNLYYSGNNAIVRYNKFKNAYLNGGGTALVAITYANGLQYYGNVVWDFLVGDGAIGFLGGDASNCLIYNNTFVRGRGAAGFASNGTNNRVFNNIFIDNRSVSISGTHDYNTFSDSDRRGEANAQINVTNGIFRNAAMNDFTLAYATAAGTTFASPYNMDMQGKARGSDGLFDRGAYEFGGTAAPAPTPVPPAPAPTATPTPAPAPAPAPGTTEWVQCAREWGYCSFSGTMQVRYGANGKYLYKTATNGTECKNAAFGGDPAPGVAKTCSIPKSTTVAAASQTLLGSSAPVRLSNDDGVNYELGMRFSSDVAGRIKAIRFYKATGETGTHTGKIYSSSGAVLAQVVFSGESASGWQQMTLSTPLAIAANTEYTVSVNTGSRQYVVTVNGMATQLTSGNLRSVVGGGVYGAVGTKPTSSYSNSNYFRDVVFEPTTP